MKSQFIEDLKWRYATKQFDASKKVSHQNIDIIKKVIQLTPTSVGLQAYKVKIVHEGDIKKQLYDAAYKQKQVLDASHILVLCPYTKITQKDIDEYIKDIAKQQEVTVASLSSFALSISKYISSIDKDNFLSWSSMQTYIVLGIILSTCSHLRIDSCPIEGFIKDEVNKILGLDKLNLNASCLLPIGYRSELDTYQFKRKYRKSLNKLFI